MTDYCTHEMGKSHCYRRTAHESGLCPQHRPGRDSLGRKENTEHKRFDEAVDMLLNGRYVDAEAKKSFFAYVDGEIDRDEARARLI